MWSCAIYVDENRDIALMSFIAAIVMLQSSEGV